MNAVDFSHAFFDEPGLLAVRFRGAAADQPRAVEPRTWAQQRAPDPGGWAFSGVAVKVGIGLLFGYLLLPDCHGSRHAPITVSDGQERDARADTTWRMHLTELASDLGPRRADLTPWVVRTLLDIPRDLQRAGDATGGWLRPGMTFAARDAQRRAHRLADDLAALGGAEGLAIILDLPGPQAVAAGAALAQVADPVPTFDSLPHPHGVVPAHDTLAAAVAWAGTYRAAAVLRPAQAPPMFLLDADRLSPYANDPQRFDNRSRARLPSAAACRELGIRRVLYVRERQQALVELDDLQELFATWRDAGIGVRHLALDHEVIDEAPSTAAGTTATVMPSSSGVHRVYDLGSGWRWPRRLPDDDVVVPRRPSPLPPGTYDGGLGRRDEVISQLSTPPERSSGASSSGGSWGRSSSSSSG